MNINEFANMLDGREYLNEIASQEEKLAKELGFVIVFGQSDDLMEFRGAFDDEAGCYRGGQIYLDKDGLFEGCEEGPNGECKYLKAAKAKCKVIEAVRSGPDGWLWQYKTDIPHATFEIFEDGEKSCKGIVFDIKDLGGAND